MLNKVKLKVEVEVKAPTRTFLRQARAVHVKHQHEVLKEPCHDFFNNALKSWKRYWKQRSPNHNGSSFSLPIDKNNE